MHTIDFAKIYIILLFSDDNFTSANNHDLNILKKPASQATSFGAKATG